MRWISIKYSQFRSTSFIIPDTDYPTIIKISSSEFVSLCSLSDCVKIEVKEEIYTFLVTSKVESGKYTLKNNNDERIEEQFTIVNKKIIFVNKKILFAVLIIILYLNLWIKLKKIIIINIFMLFL